MICCTRSRLHVAIQQCFFRFLGQHLRFVEADVALQHDFGRRQQFAALVVAHAEHAACSTAGIRARGPGCSATGSLLPRVSGQHVENRLGAFGVGAITTVSPLARMLRFNSVPSGEVSGKPR